MSFVHLHNHSDFSLLDGAAGVKSMVAKAKALGMPGLALTDHGNLFGALEFYKECRAQGVNPIVGSEFYVAGASRFEKTGTESGNKYYHLVLLAKDAEGWSNLVKLSSASYVEGFYYKPRIDDEILVRHARGLVCSTACIAGEIPQLILMGRAEAAEAKVLRYRELFGADSFYLELQDHGIPEERTVNAALVALGRKHGIPLLATNDMHYLDRPDASAHDILLCVGTNRKVSDRDRMRFPGAEFYMKTPEEMAALFSEVPEALSNTLRINEMVRLTIPQPGPLLPDFEIPPDFGPSGDARAEEPAARVRAAVARMDDRTICQPHPEYGKRECSDLAPEQRKALESRLAQPVTRYFIHLSNEGFRRRYGEGTREQRDRLDFELAVIILMDFTGYFLIVADFINWAKDHGIPVGPGRGSGAGSIVAYSLRITDIEPLKYNLLFERFLNPERVSMPDFDVDFCFERREEVIDYVTRKYGTDRVGQIITFGTLKAKAVIKDVARALDIPFEDSNNIAKLVPDDPKMTLAKAFEQEPKLRSLAEDPRYTELFEAARKLEGRHRHASFHAAGIVIGKTALTDYVPLYRDPKTGALATQFTMDQLEACGLVKMDFLGLKTLTLIQNTLALVAKRGIELTEESIPEDDAATFRLLGEGKSTSIFQFESSGMQGVLKQAKPDRIEDLIALNALYRPGPMDNIPQFVDCKFGREPIQYPHPVLEPILKETYGVIVYQEQVMQATQLLAGFSLGGADLLRRAMGKKKAEEMAKQRALFVRGCAERNSIPEARANEIFDLLDKFAGYGFNKSHAAAYAVVAYRTAYLKANFPAEFMAANLTNEISNPDKMTEYIGEARSMGIEILPPDVNRSETRFTVSEGRIVYGLLGIKGVGEGLVRSILEERERNGPYKDFIEFLERVGMGQMNKKSLEALVLAGCFDSLGHARQELVLSIDRAVDYVQRKEEARAFGQASLFDGSGEAELPPFAFEPSPEFPRKEILQREKDLLGFYFSGHPMDEFRKLWERCADLDLSRPDRAAPKRKYTVVAQLTEWRETLTKSGRRMAFGAVGDFRGSLPIVVFANALEQYRDRFLPDAVLCLRGEVDTSRSEPGFKVDEVLDPSQLREKSYRQVHLRLAGVRAEEDLWDLRDALFESAGPCSVVFHVPGTGGEVTVLPHSGISCAPLPEVMERLRETRHVAEVWFD